MQPIISPSLSPNTEADDIVLAGKMLCMPWRWYEGEAHGLLAREWARIIEVPHIFFLESARSCLYALFRALGIGTGDEVLVQAFTCVTVPNPVMWAGARPMYVDIDSATLGMSPQDAARKITHRTKAIIIQHTFGIPAQLEALIALARKHNLVVIEDCAHTIGGMAGGRGLGTFGDAAIFSFGRDKAFSSVSGGCVVVRDDAHAKNFSHEISEVMNPPSVWVMQQLMHPGVVALAKTLMPIAGSGSLVLKAAQSLGLISKALTPQELAGARPPIAVKRYPNALAALAFHQLQKRDRMNAHRKNIARYYREHLTLPGVTHGPAWEEHSVMRYPIFVEHAQELVDTLRSVQIFLDDWRGSALIPRVIAEETFLYEKGSCPQAEKIALTIIPLPTHIGITPEYAMRVCHAIKKYL